MKKILNEWKMFLLKEAEGKSPFSFSDKKRSGQSLEIFRENTKTYWGELKNNDHATAIFKGSMHCVAAKHLKGKNREHEKWDFKHGSGKGKGRYDDKGWNDFKEYVKNNGFPGPVFVVIEWDGDEIIGSVYEGNHRIRIGCQLGIPIPVEIKFFGQSEQYIKDEDIFPLWEGLLISNFLIAPNTDRG
jgi:hypothetical protein